MFQKRNSLNRSVTWSVVFAETSNQQKPIISISTISISIDCFFWFEKIWCSNGFGANAVLNTHRLVLQGRFMNLECISFSPNEQLWFWLFTPPNRVNRPSSLWTVLNEVFLYIFALFWRVASLHFYVRIVESCLKQFNGLINVKDIQCLHFGIKYRAPSKFSTWLRQTFTLFFKDQPNVHSYVNIQKVMWVYASAPKSYRNVVCKFD